MFVVPLQCCHTHFSTGTIILYCIECLSWANTYKKGDTSGSTKVLVMYCIALHWGQHGQVGRVPNSWNVAGSISGRNSRIIFSSRVAFLCWLFFGVHSTPMLTQWHIKDPRHSAKSAGGGLHLTPIHPWSNEVRVGWQVGTYRGHELTCTWSGSIHPQPFQLTEQMWTVPGLHSETGVHELIFTLQRGRLGRIQKGKLVALFTSSLSIGYVFSFAWQWSFLKKNWIIKSKSRWAAWLKKMSFLTFCVFWSSFRMSAINFASDFGGEWFVNLPLKSLLMRRNKTTRHYTVLHCTVLYCSDALTCRKVH